MSFRVLSARDLIAFTVIACRALATGAATTEPTDLVGYGFQVADQFVERSLSRWAVDEREQRERKRK